MNYRLSSTGQYLPELEYTEDSSEQKNRQVGQNVAGVGESRVPDGSVDIRNGESVADNSENNRQRSGEPLSGTGRAVQTGQSPSVDVLGNSVVGENAPAEERRSLWETIITALAEMVETDSVKIGGRTIMYYEIIDRLNEIIENSYLSECFIGFEEHWQDLITKKKITYPKAYMKSCLWNWLCDFEFEDFNDFAKMKDL